MRLKTSIVVSIALVVLLLVQFARPIRVACIGDSVTAGNGGASYPVELQALLGSRFEVKNFGVGARALLKKSNQSYWAAQAFIDAKRFVPDIVIINLGINDTKSENWEYKDDFEKDYVAMIDELASLPSSPRIYLCLPTPLFLEDRFGIRKAVLEQEVIPRIREVALLRKLPVIDLQTPLFDKPELFSDFVHPNSQGMQIVASSVAAAIKQGGA
jgi:lysophospholipase L1-like esterase